MKNFLPFGIIFLSLLLMGCPKGDSDSKSEIKPEGGRLEDGLSILFGSKRSDPTNSMAGFQHPQCDKEVEFKHIKLSLIDENKTDNIPCQPYIAEGYFTPNPGNTIIFDISYYSNIRIITIPTIEGCNPGNVITLIDKQGKVIAKKQLSRNDSYAKFFDKVDGVDLSNIKEVRFNKTCEGGPISFDLVPYY